jgi:hypothetical protein
MWAPHAAVGGEQWRSSSIALLTCVWKHRVHRKLKRISNREADAKITHVGKVISLNAVETKIG